IVSRATAKSPDDRYATAAEMHADLAAAHVALGGNPLSSHHSALRTVTGAAGQSSGAPSVLSRLKILGVLVAAGVIAAAAWVAWIGRGHRGADPAAASKEAAPAVTVPLAQGVTDSTIAFGMSTAYSGTNRDSGMSIALGFQTLFEAVNESGGVNGRQLKLTVLDDGYEPDRALANMRDFFEKRKVFAIAGNLGTSTAEATVPYAIEHRLLLFAPCTGTAFVRHEPPDRYVFNYRASCREETAALIHYFVKIRRIPANTIAVLAQDDAYGEDGFQGAARALRVYGVQPEDIFRAKYERNTLQTADAVEQMVQRKSKIQAIVMVSTYGAASQFVKGVQDHKMNVTLGGISFGGSNSLAMLFKAMGPQYGEGMIVTQVVPHPKSGATGVIRYRELLHKFHPEAEPGFMSLEGFISAECLVEGLKRTGPQLTTEKLIDALESIRDLDLGIGPIISFGPSRHQASKKVWGTVLDRDRNFQNLDLE
ncbi:MAG TPA: ABC transporter substrate-binding protein, partial [Planctomycetaceae bacterium]|nr:ABC transporter substrate-binding protein [Planctomycetaceae bacterium]